MEESVVNYILLFELISRRTSYII